MRKLNVPVVLQGWQEHVWVWRHSYLKGGQEEKGKQQQEMHGEGSRLLVPQQRSRPVLPSCGRHRRRRRRRAARCALCFCGWGGNVCG